MLTHSFEDLAQAFRVLLESEWSCRRLLEVDRAEAIGNLESGLNTQLNAFHNIYDNMLQNDIGPMWYLEPQLLMLLVIRNARHHNKANRIRTLYNFHRNVVENPTTVKNYFYVDFPSPPEEEGGDCFDVHMSWSDIDNMLSLPRAESRLRPDARERIRNYVNADKFEEEATKLGFQKEDIFINYVPLSLNAGIALHPHVNQHVNVNEDSTEARFFLHHFEKTRPAITDTHEYSVIPFKLPPKD
ncbi:hypothetical protein EC843_10438 [Buttiauxella sp. JUb87]|uniref:hypothetical protein n=1 Tax=Buttiauxella sp. JUb87 TaxID=2485129 RepID=UPI0010621730|nr:hypothetical protein [Buttiauxella sp. JUb87]TDN51029.1 hypothetical protein EC843_10438 [Buttiauxella sp. JUb87]